MVDALSPRTHVPLTRRLRRAVAVWPEEPGLTPECTRYILKLRQARTKLAKLEGSDPTPCFSRLKSWDRLPDAPQPSHVTQLGAAQSEKYAHVHALFVHMHMCMHMLCMYGRRPTAHSSSSVGSLRNRTWLSFSAVSTSSVRMACAS